MQAIDIAEREDGEIRKTGKFAFNSGLRENAA